jgi:hypothetical protein
VRRFDDLLPDTVRAGIGHNGGPPLDVSYSAWMWRKAHKRAWDNPGREIVMLRLRRAERLGLSYEAYTSVILDRGARLSAVIVILSRERLNKTAAKLATLSDCCVMLCAEDDLAIPESLDKLAAHRTSLGTEGPLAAIKELVARSKLPPSEIFLVGPEPLRRIAERAGLGLFLDETVYFS